MLILVCSGQILAQDQVIKTFSASYSQKEVFIDGSISLVKGEVFYFLPKKQLAYKNTIPLNQLIIIQDSTMKIFVRDKLENEYPYPNLLDFSIFHLILTSKLQDFGLHDTPFKIVETKKENGVILTRWEIPYKTRSTLKAFELAQKDGKLMGLISYGEKDEVLSKQVFTDYIYVQGFWFPAKSMELKYSAQGVHKKLMNYSNIQFKNEDQLPFDF